MTKAELISLISKSSGIEKTEVSFIVANFMDIVKRSLDEGENVYLRGFGSFIVKKRAEKKARNISKNTTITIPEHNAPVFKPAKAFLEAVAYRGKKPAKTLSDTIAHGRMKLKTSSDAAPYGRKKTKKKDEKNKK
jgi:DNA-binding protein HU-beta